MFDIFELFERWLRTHDVRNNPNWRLLSLIISLLFDSFLYLIIILYFLCYGVVVMLCSLKIKYYSWAEDQASEDSNDML